VAVLGAAAQDVEGAVMKLKKKPSGTAPETDHLGMERMLFFSDAVFAIVITLLALEIRLPGVGGLDDSGLRRALAELTPKFLAFVISFLVIGLFWLGHHRKFRFITRYDAVLLRLNLLMLMAVASVPFFTSVLSESFGRTAVVSYALIMMIVALLSVLMSWYGLRRGRLVDAAVSPQDRRLILAEPLKVAAVFALSILIAQWRTGLALWSWLLLIAATTDFHHVSSGESRP
jgi:uncharacterized membrane protein